MRTWSWTHDFESYLYWWPITGASIIRDAGKEKNKAIKGKSRRGRVTNLILTKLKGYSTKKAAKLCVQFRLQFDCAEPSRTPKCNDAPRRVKRAEHREQWWWTKFCISFIYKEVKYIILCQCTVTFLFSIYPSVPGRRVLDADGVLVNHSNDSQKRWLHKETHVCSPLFKCPA